MYDGRMRSLLLLACALSIAAQDIPRPEYPQPQFEREQWLSLNGQWEFEFDDANAGLQEGWAGGAKKFSRGIVVPFAFESRSERHRRHVVPPVGLVSRDVHRSRGLERPARAAALRRGRLPRQRLGQRAAWPASMKADTRRSASTSPTILKAAPNVVTVRAEDPPTDRYIPRGKQYWEPKSREHLLHADDRHLAAGLARSGRRQLRSTRVRIPPTMDGAVRSTHRLSRSSRPVRVPRAIVSSRATDVVASAMSRPDGPRATASAVRDATRGCGSSGQANLYDVTFELRRGSTVLDRVQSYFGFREVGVERKRMTAQRPADRT